DIWSEVLGIEKSKISTNANFFDIGGHSLKTMIIIAKIHKAFNIKLQLIQVFRVPTIKGIASLIEALWCVNDQESDSGINEENESEETFI
ncbi:MAG: hypothetical protein QG657_5095, partial [Acidobacteriota bacterium]|nr:hypothetical protein [Acidobacteriota bacterium]